ncbi:hypothetical protein P7K49_034065 [Saguinus oedipus]|uniref:Uncharacterized protein n=1 Tax=Saguinus oedipus TaxID=9490 RepID=A0ABQ9TTP2_SAGOE|nr:hypothetical protein P7K49_034065 [Saguinus oedipus]
MPELDGSLAQPKHPPRLNRPARGLRDTDGKQEFPGSCLRSGTLLQPCPAPRVPICGSHRPPPPTPGRKQFLLQGTADLAFVPGTRDPLASRLSAGGPGEGCRLHEGPPASAQPQVPGVTLSRAGSGCATRARSPAGEQAVLGAFWASARETPRCRAPGSQGRRGDRSGRRAELPHGDSDPPGPRGPLTETDDGQLRPGARRALQPRGRALIHAGLGGPRAPPPAARLRLWLRLQPGFGLGLRLARRLRPRRRRRLPRRLCAVAVQARSARRATSAAASRAPRGLSGGRQGGPPPAAAPAPKEPRRGRPGPGDPWRAHAPRRVARPAPAPPGRPALRPACPAGCRRWSVRGSVGRPARPLTRARSPEA